MTIFWMLAVFGILWLLPYRITQSVRTLGWAIAFAAALTLAGAVIVAFETVEQKRLIAKSGQMAADYWALGSSLAY
jgi:hypothetical protein